MDLLHKIYGCCIKKSVCVREVNSEKIKQNQNIKNDIRILKTTERTRS